MAHNLATTDGKTAMFYAGEAPWHGLGTKLDEPATAAEAIGAAGLDYEVEVQDLFTGSGILVPMARAVVRSDSQEILGSVGTYWKPVQNRECFGFLDAVVADGRLRYHTAGALGKGERVWMLAKIPGEIRVAGTDDVTNKFLLLSNSHDGRSSLRCFFTPIRVVCQNTLNAAENRSTGAGITIRHTGELPTKIREAQRVLGFAEKFYDDLGDRINFLASKPIGSVALSTYFSALYPDPEEPEEQKRAATNARETRDALAGLFEHGMGQDMPGVAGTYWAAYNAVTEFVDHAKPQRAGKLDPEIGRQKRLESNWFGVGSGVKGHAFEMAMQMAESN